MTRAYRVTSHRQADTNNSAMPTYEQNNQRYVHHLFTKLDLPSFYPWAIHQQGHFAHTSSCPQLQPYYNKRTLSTLGDLTRWPGLTTPGEVTARRCGLRVTRVLAANVLHVGLCLGVGGVFWAVIHRCMWCQQLVDGGECQRCRHDVGHPVDVDTAKQEANQRQEVDDVGQLLVVLPVTNTQFFLYSLKANKKYKKSVSS